MTIKQKLWYTINNKIQHYPLNLKLWFSGLKLPGKYYQLLGVCWDMHNESSVSWHHSGIKDKIDDVSKDVTLSLKADSIKVTEHCTVL